MANAIDILIRAIWQGGPQTTAAQASLRNLGSAISETQIQAAALEARQRSLGTVVSDLGQKVSDGTLTTQQAREAYRQYTSQLGELTPVTEKAATSTASLASRISTFAIVAGTTAIAAKRLFSAIEAGAGLELTAQRFDRLAMSIGTTGDALRDDLITATSGMVSSAQAMALATDLIGLSLVTTHDDAVRLGRIVTELDADIGELTLALANQTTKRFDQLGISLDGFDDRLNRLKGTMSDEKAFTMAFLEQAEAQIERVGGASQTTAGDIRRLQADWAALNEEIQIFLALKVGPALADASGRTEEAFVSQATAAAEAADSFGDIEKAHKDLQRAAEELDRNYPVDFALNPAHVELLRRLAELSDSHEEFERTAVRIFGPSGFVAAISASGARHSEAFYEMATSVDEHSDAMQRNDVIMRQTAAGIGQIVDEYEELDEIIRRVTVSLDRNAAALAAIEPFEARREGIDASGLVAEQQQEQLALEFNLLQERSDLFQDFQSDLTTINQREEQRRLEITEQFEERRTQAVANYNQQRLQEEEDFQRRQARQDVQLADDIADVRQDANERLQDLEEDHLDRMRQITDDAAFALQGAASRLDARAVANIKRERDRALQEERERFDDQRGQIQEDAEERIADLQEFHDERRAQEEEDRRIRLQRMEQAHQEQLRELKKQEQDRLRQIRTQAQQERNERERQYTEERFQLSDHWDDRARLERQWMDIILEREEEWWRRRSNLVGGGGSTGGTGDGGTGDTGGGDDAGGAPTGDGRPSRWWLEHQAFQIANPSTTDAALAWQRYFRSLTDEQLAAWIEQHSDIDVPGFRMGGMVGADMLALVGEEGPELVRLPRGAQVYDARTSRSMMSSVNTGDINVIVNEARRPGQTGREVREELMKVLEEVVA